MGLARSKWANPFKISAELSRGEVLGRFERYIVDSGLVLQVGELAGKVLLCHCRADEPCHGDILVEHAERGGRQEVGENAGLEEGAAADDGLPARLPPEPGAEDDSLVGCSGPGWRGMGPPRRTQVMGRPRAFHDGGGLCSPGRWPRERRVLPEGVGGSFFVELKTMLRDYWAEASGGKDELYTFALRLAAGQVVENPFGEEFVRKGLAVLCRAFGLSEADLEVAPRQCFRLGALSKVLGAFGDPDADFPLSLVGGVRVGVGVSLPRAPAIYEAKVSWTLGDPQGEPETERDNYKSMAGFEDRVEALFREEAAQDWMEEFPDEAAKEVYGDRLVVSSLAVVDEGSKIRVVHDATRGVALNHQIKVQDQVRYPGAGELRCLLEERRARGAKGFAVLADAAKAHRRVAISPLDWGLLGCRTRAGHVWIHKVGTYGVSSAGYWWSRLAGAFHRLAFYLAGPGGDLEALLFADDLLALVGSRAGLEDLGAIIFMYTLLGYPFSWKKFRGGDVVGWIGYEIDFGRFSVGISLGRARWLIEWVGKTLEEGKVLVDDLVAVLGRFCFAMGPLDFLRPFLAPIFAWVAAVRGAGRLMVPWSVAFLLRFLAGQLGGAGRVCEIRAVGADLGEAFRSDAKAEGDTVVVGGWECIRGARPAEARWFSVALTRATAPWAFARGEPFRTIAALELYATLLSVMLFSGSWPVSSSGRVRLTGTTDNLGNSWILARLMSTKFPMLVVLGELAVQLRRRELQLQLDWAPRLQNEEADALTNGDFSAFRAANRIEVDLTKLEFEVLPELMSVSEGIYEDILRRRQGAVRPAQGEQKKGGVGARLRERDPWG